VADEFEGSHQSSEEDRKKAKRFFDQGNTVSATGNFDYAIEMYLSGLAYDPDSVDAHQTLLDISIKRKATGGKKLGFMDVMKLKRPSKDDKQNMLHAEKLLSYDPGNPDHMVSILQNALRGGFHKTVMWVGPLLQKTNADSAKPEVNKFIILRDAYKGLKQWKLAADACQYAAMLRPDDMDLQNELKHLGAMHTMKEGNYEKSESFRGSVKDMEGQSKLMVQDKDVRTMDQLSGQIAEAKKNYDSDPSNLDYLSKYVDLLVKTELPEYENQAIDLLEAAHKSTKQFRFRQAAGKVRMGQMTRMERSLRQVAAEEKSDESRKTYAEFVTHKLEEELKEYQLWAENYPTDSSFRYQVGVRLYALHKYDEAIPVLQQVRSDPKFRTDASIALGRAFLDAGYVDESVDTLAVVINDYAAKGDSKSVGMTYWYARGLEQKGDTAAALKSYSQVAQWNFNYLDVQARIKRLRPAAAPPAGQATGNP
jgi:tetratricopeptide (TPR) repeat protein